MRDGDPGEDVRDDPGGGLGGPARRRGFRSDQQPVGEDRFGHGLDVVGDDEGAAVEGGMGPGGSDQVQGRTRGGAQDEFRVPAGRRHEIDDVAAHLVGHVHRTDQGDESGDLGGFGDRVDRVERLGVSMAVQHGQFGRGRRVTHGHSRGETVPLRLGQGIGAFHLDGVLGRDDHERRFQVIGDTINGDLVFLHAFEECRLRFGSGSVDLVGYDQVGEDRSGAELEVAGVLVVDAHPRDVAGQQVGCELDTADAGVDRASQRLGEHRLADAGHVLDEQVALGEQDDQGCPDHLGLAVDDALDRAGHARRDIREVAQAGPGLAPRYDAGLRHRHVGLRPQIGEVGPADPPQVWHPSRR